MAKGYPIARVTVTGPKSDALCGKVAGDLLKAMGTRRVFAPATASGAEQSPEARTVSFKLESLAEANAFWNSADDHISMAPQRGAAAGDQVLAAGVI